MILRDKGRITRILILLELLKGKKKLREIAEEIDITVQGVSEYMRNMEKEGFVKDGEITVRGLEFLSEAIEEMGDFVSEANRIMKKVRVVEAIAGEFIEKGSKVGLFMEDGYIRAYMRKSSSTGIAINTADEGEVVGVTNLRGVLHIDYGKILVFSMPSVEELHDSSNPGDVDTDRIREIIENNRDAKIGVCGALAYVTVKNIASIDFQFSAVNSAVDAYYRGISTILFVSHPMLPHVLATLEERGVKYTFEKIGKKII